MDMNCVFGGVGTGILYTNCTRLSNSHVAASKYLSSKNCLILILLNIKHCTYWCLMLD